MTKTDTRVTSNLVNVIPWTYSDDTIAEQSQRPRFGDMWITEEEIESGFRNEADGEEEKQSSGKPLPIRNYNQTTPKAPLKIT